MDFSVGSVTFSVQIERTFICIAIRSMAGDSRRGIPAIGKKSRSKHSLVLDSNGTSQYVQRPLVEKLA